MDEFCSCCCLPLLPQFAGNIHATWGPFFSRTLYTPGVRREEEGARAIRPESGKPAKRDEREEGGGSFRLGFRDLGVACSQSQRRQSVVFPDRLRHRRLANTTPDATTATGFLMLRSRRERSRPGVAAAHWSRPSLSEETFCNWEFTGRELGCSDIGLKSNVKSYSISRY